MKLMVQSYDSDTPEYNAEAEETAFLDYRIAHRFNGPAECWIELNDPTGAIAQKYSPAAAAGFIGAGKVTVEDPTGTDMFFGRIISANAGARTVTLYCQDWLCQLDDEQIDYDMREKLGTTDLRESTLRSDSVKLTPAEVDGGDNFIYDDGEYGTAGGMGFANNQHDTMSVILTAAMAGKKTWRFFPYKGVDTDADGYSDDYYEVWVDDVENDRCFANNR